MTMINLGKKYGEEYGVTAKKSSENKIYYPTLSLSKIKPGALKVGDTVTARVKLKLKRCSENQDEDGARYSCDFDVLGIDLPNKSSGIEYAIGQERNQRRK